MTRNSKRNLPKNLSTLNLNHIDQQLNDDFTTKSMINMTTLIKQQHKDNDNYETSNTTTTTTTKTDNSEMLERGRKRRFRYFVAWLGLTVAAMNCYAQATFCIAIVEMVLPADYDVFKGESGGSQAIKVVVPSTTISNNGTTLSRSQSDTNTQPSPPLMEELENFSCPVEYKYRDYYDEWRFSNASSSTTTTTTTNNLASLLLLSSSSQQSSDKSSLLSPAINNNSNNNNNNNQYIIDISNRFDWDASRQGLLLGAFAMGMAPLQVLGGRLAEIYGAKWVLLIGGIGTALTNLTIPVLAHLSYTLLVINRILMGVSQAGMEPALMCLMAQWLAPAETGFFISMLLFALCIGFFLGSLLSSFLLTIGLGWALTYYVTGGLNLIISLIWLIYASKGPEESGLISEEELAYIKHEQQKEMDKCRERNKGLRKNNDLKTTTATTTTSNIIQDKSGKGDYHEQEQEREPEEYGDEEEEEELDRYKGHAPWMNILSTPSVWAFIICKISVRWCADVLTIELPTYLANVLHLSIKLNGILNSLSSAFFAIFSFITGYFVNELLKRTHESTAAAAKELECNEKKSPDIIINNNNPIRISSTTTTTTTMKKSLMSKTTLRKLFQSVASFGSAIAIFLMTHYDCNIKLSMSMMFILSACLMMGTGGELQIPYDMTSQYPGTLHGMACTLSVSGWLAPPLIGLILGDQPSSRYRWSIVWYLTASINFLGGLVFILFADASPRNFDKRRPRKLRRRPSQGPGKTIIDKRTMTSNAAAAAALALALEEKTQLQQQHSNGNISIADEISNNGQQQQYKLAASPLLHHHLHQHHHQHQQKGNKQTSRSAASSSTCFNVVDLSNETSIRRTSQPPLLMSSSSWSSKMPRPFSGETITSDCCCCCAFTCDEKNDGGGDLLNIRQLEGGSLLSPNRQLDPSLLSDGQVTDIMFPYQQKTTQKQETGANSNLLNRLWFVNCNSTKCRQQQQQRASSSLRLRKHHHRHHPLCPHRQERQFRSFSLSPAAAAAAAAKNYHHQEALSRRTKVEDQSSMSKIITRL